VKKSSLGGVRLRLYTGLSPRLADEKAMFSLFRDIVTIIAPAWMHLFHGRCMWNQQIESAFGIPRHGLRAALYVA
jgi:hypothetical protein